MVADRKTDLSKGGWRPSRSRRRRHFQAVPLRAAEAMAPSLTLAEAQVRIQPFDLWPGKSGATARNDRRPNARRARSGQQPGCRRASQGTERRGALPVALSPSRSCQPESVDQGAT